MIDAGWSKAWAASVLAALASGIGFYSLPILLFELNRRNDWHVSSVSAAITFHYLVGAAVALTVPTAHVRLGIHGTVAFGFTSLGLGVLTWASADAYWQLFPAAVLTAIGWAAVGAVTLNAIVTEWYVRERPKAIGIAFNGATLGGLLFPPLWAILIDRFGLQLAAVVLVGVTTPMAIAISSLAFFGAQVGSGQSPTRPARSRVTIDLAIDTQTRLQSKTSIFDRRFNVLALASAFALFGQVGLLTHLVVGVAKVSVGTAPMALLMVVPAFAMLGRYLLGSYIRERSRWRAAAINTTIQLTGVLTLACSNSSFLLVLLACALFGLGFGNTASLPLLIAQTAFSVSVLPNVTARMTAINQLFIAMSPLAFGAMYDVEQSFVSVMWLTAACQVLAALLFVYGHYITDFRMSSTFQK